MRDPLALLGMARRAGALAYGTGSTRRALKEGRARLILFAQDASETQRDKVMKLSSTRDDTSCDPRDA